MKLVRPTGQPLNGKIINIIKKMYKKINSRHNIVVGTYTHNNNLVRTD